MPRSLADIDPDDPDVGGKAAGLARLIRAGLTVPPGFVIPASSTATEDEIDRAAAAIGAPLIVRSSATCEDRAAALAPGVFASRRDVAPGASLHRAIAEVRASLDEPPAVAYLERRGLDRSRVGMAVIVQRQIAGETGTAYTREPGDLASSRLLIEVAASGPAPAIALIDRATLRAAWSPGRDLEPVAIAALAAEAAIGAPADVEWVLAGDNTPFVVQARPIPPPARDPLDDELTAALSFSAEDPATLWTWDASHNPDPLSAAQEGLVELVEARGASPVRQRVARGFLYVAGDPPPTDVAPAELPRVWRDELRPTLLATLARLEAEPRDLERTLDAYVELYAVYARRVAPAVTAAKRAGGAGLELDRPSPAAYAAVSPAWDVASPSYGAALPAAPARRIDEEDDLIFARAQAGVRRALAVSAERLGVALDDLVHTPLAETRLAARAGNAPPGLHERARAAAAERERWRAFTPPMFVLAGRPVRRATAPIAPGVLRGRGGGGRARGRAAIRSGDAPWSAPPSGAILVVATVIPQHAPLLAGAAAVVAEQGGLLGHGAALARDLGIPCVVGATGARTELRDGDEVYVDADAGLVVRT